MWAGGGGRAGQVPGRESEPGASTGVLHHETDARAPVDGSPCCRVCGPWPHWTKGSVGGPSHLALPSPPNPVPTQVSSDLEGPRDSPGPWHLLRRIQQRWAHPQRDTPITHTACPSPHPHKAVSHHNTLRAASQTGRPARLVTRAHLKALEAWLGPGEEHCPCSLGASGRSRGHPTTPWDKAEHAEEPGREHDCRGPDGPQQMESRMPPEATEVSCGP